jgi:hypothetical protein
MPGHRLKIEPPLIKSECIFKTDGDAWRHGVPSVIQKLP